MTTFPEATQGMKNVIKQFALALHTELHGAMSKINPDTAAEIADSPPESTTLLALVALQIILAEECTVKIDGKPADLVPVVFEQAEELAAKLAFEAMLQDVLNSITIDDDDPAANAHLN